MVIFIKYTLAATLAVRAVNAATHNHQHRHAKLHARSQVGIRDSDRVKYIDAPVETVWELNGRKVSPKEAAKGLQDGKYVVIGESTPIAESPSPPPAPTTSTKEFKAQFIEHKSSSTASITTAPPSSTTPPASSTASASSSSAPTSSKTSTPSSTPSAAPESGTGATGIDAHFPSGKIKCSTFPSQYGAVAVPHLDLDSWTGLQFVPGYAPGQTDSISDIVTGIPGQSCTAGCMCSYACPAGYEKTQWPSSQGSTRQSIGGLYCNSDGYLELTRPESSTLCEPGVGGVFIQNDLDELVSTCQTDYPGTESMTIPNVANPGERIPLCNPNQGQYYQWDGHGTSAQFYVNNKGVPVEEACVWRSASYPDSAGNWAPINVGVGQAADGSTYISIFANLPTSRASLNFNIEITGDVSTECAYKNGQYSGGSQGCTTAMPSGGSAVIRYF